MAREGKEFEIIVELLGSISKEPGRLEEIMSQVFIDQAKRYAEKVGPDKADAMLSEIMEVMERNKCGIVAGICFMLSICSTGIVQMVGWHTKKMTAEKARPFARSAAAAAALTLEKMIVEMATSAHDAYLVERALREAESAAGGDPEKWAERATEGGKREDQG